MAGQGRRGDRRPLRNRGSLPALVLREPELGIDGVRAYLERIFGEEDAIECRFGEPVVGDDRAAVEWWSSWIEAGAEMTMAGVTILRFDPDGMVIDTVTTGTSRSAGSHRSTAGDPRRPLHAVRAPPLDSSIEQQQEHRPDHRPDDPGDLHRAVVDVGTEQDVAEEPTEEAAQDAEEPCSGE